MKDQALQVAQIHGSPAGDGDFLPGQNEPEAGNGLKDFQRSQGLPLGEGRAGDGIEEVHGHNMHAEFLQRKSQITAVFAGLAHAQDAPGTDFDARLLEVLDRLEPILIGMRGADLRKEPARGFQVVIVTLQACLREAVGHPLALDHAQRGIGPRLAALL